MTVLVVTSKLRKPAWKRNSSKATHSGLKAPKMTQEALKRLWSVPAGVDLRYHGIKGIYWYWLSIQVRREDFKKYHGACIDQCGKVAERWQDFDCGHGIAASRGGINLLFRRENLAGQLKACNNPKWSPLAPIGFMRGVDLRWGVGTADMLWNLKDTVGKEPTNDEYMAKIKGLWVYPNHE